MLGGNIQAIALSVYSSPVKMKVPPLIFIALVEPWYASPRIPAAHEPEVSSRLCTGVSDIWGLTMDLLFLAKAAHIPTLTMRSRGKATLLVQTGTQK